MQQFEEVLFFLIGRDEHHEAQRISHRAIVAAIEKPWLFRPLRQERGRSSAIAATCVASVPQQPPTIRARPRLRAITVSSAKRGASSVSSSARPSSSHGGSRDVLPWKATIRASARPGRWPAADAHTDGWTQLTA